MKYIRFVLIYIFCATSLYLCGKVKLTCQPMGREEAQIEFVVVDMKANPVLGLTQLLI